MEKAKRIVFSNEQPNDQGGIIPNNVIDFSRYNANPVILPQHDWESLPIGIMQDISFDGQNWTGTPVFHEITDESKTYKKMWEGGFLKACSIGGACEWETTGQFTTNAEGRRVPTAKLNKDGLKVAEYFGLYEISMVTLPSNPSALALNSIKIYDSEFIEQNTEKLSTNLLTLKAKTMAKKETVEAVNEEIVEATTTEQVESTEEVVVEATSEVIEHDKSKHVVLGSEMPSVMDKILTAMESGFEKITNMLSPEKVTEETPIPFHDEPGGGDPALTKIADEIEPQHEPTGLACDLEAETMESVEIEIKEEEEVEEEKELSTKLSAKTPEEMIAEGVKLAPSPEIKIKMSMNKTTLTQLHSEIKAGKADSNEAKAYGRILDKDNHVADASDYSMLATSIANDPKFKPVLDKLRFRTNLSQNEFNSISGNNSNPDSRQGLNLASMIQKLSTVTLGTSADALANPDILAIEFLPMFLFKLFPDQSWKSEIPIFGVTETGKNLGVIWTNILSDPTITRGNKPAATTGYASPDASKAMSLMNFWLGAMEFTPLTMHMLRYDQMATNWAQAFMKLNTEIDDYLLYVLASTVPAAFMTETSGGSFNIPSTTDVNAFYNNWFTCTGNLAKPVLNDLIRLEQLYTKQNFNLESDNPVVVLDPTANSFLYQDSEVKNKLTEFKQIAGTNMMKFMNTIIHKRSRTAIYDQATGLVKDPSGVIPSTATSANVSFIPSQVGIGLGMLDVFVIQSPDDFGYKMSASVRQGISPLRRSYEGTALLNYGTPSI